MPLLSLLPLFGFSLALKYWLGIRSALSILLAVAVWLVAAYVGGLLDLLELTATALWVIGVLLLVWCVAKQRTLLSRLLDPPYVLLFVFCCAFWFVHSGSQYFYYDEYSHWGVYIKDMWAIDAFWRGDSNTLHGRYPPAAPLWQYAFTVFSPRIDSSAYLAQFVLLIAPLLALFDKLTWRQAGWMAGLVVASVIGLANFGHGIASLYVDHIVATWLGGVLVAFVIQRNPSFRDSALLCLPLVVLSLIKGVGIAFAVAAAGIICALFLLRELRSAPVVRAIGVSTALFVVLVAPSLVAMQAWSMNRDAEGIERTTYSFSGVVRGILSGDRALNDDGTAVASDAVISDRFITVVQRQQLAKDEKSTDYNEFSYQLMPLFDEPFRLTTSTFFILFALFFVLLLTFGKPSREDRLKWSLLAAGLLCTAIGYTLVLYASYLIAFEGRGLELPSFLRYIHSVVLALFIVAIAALTPAASLVNRELLISGKTFPVGGGILAGVLLLLIVVETPYLRSFTHENPRLQLRADLEEAMTDVREAVGNDSIWIYFPADQPNGFIGQLIQFQLSPTPATVERALDFFDRPKEQVVAELQNYDFVWLPILPPGVDKTVTDMLEVDISAGFVKPFINDRGAVAFKPFSLD